MTLANKVQQFNEDADIAHQIIHGDENTTVETEGGPVRSFAKVLADFVAGVTSALVTFIQSGTGAAPRTVQDALREVNHSVWNYFLASEATAEGMINRAIAAHNRVHIPAGVYEIDTNVGIKLKTGTVITGDGKNKTILTGKLGTGGTMAELAAYAKGSIIKREFNPSGANAYVNDIYIADIGVVLNHPNDAITTTAIQIGFDMRNITGVTIERCHTGNIPPVGGALVKSYSKPFVVQGYPAVFGNVAGSDPAYAGGEKNLFLNCTVFGGYKCVVQDDPALSGSSAAYALTIRDCDIQTGHWLIAQMGQYSAGNVHVDNILQDIQKQSGNVSPSYVMYYDGYNNEVRAKYIEGGSNVDYQLYLDTDANNNVIELKMAGVSSGAGAIVDNSNANSRNLIRHFGTDGTGELVEIYNKAYKRAWIKFHWDGSSLITDGKFGATVSRVGVGDYLVTWDLPFPSDDYHLPAPGLDTNASGHGGMASFISHTSSNARVVTYAQNGGTSTKIDPRFVWVGANQ